MLMFNPEAHGCQVARLYMFDGQDPEQCYGPVSLLGIMVMRFSEVSHMLLFQLDGGSFCPLDAG